MSQPRHLQLLRFIETSRTYDRLLERYGPDRTHRIMDGKDPATNADLAAWQGLGRREAA